MNTYKQAGEAIFLVHEGNQQIAEALGKVMMRFGKGIIDSFAAALNRVPGPQQTI